MVGRSPLSPLDRPGTISACVSSLGSLWVPRTRFPCKSAHSQEAIRVLALETSGLRRTDGLTLSAPHFDHRRRRRGRLRLAPPRAALLPARHTRRCLLFFGSLGLPGEGVGC